MKFYRGELRGLLARYLMSTGGMGFGEANRIAHERVNAATHPELVNIVVPFHYDEPTHGEDYDQSVKCHCTAEDDRYGVGCGRGGQVDGYEKTLIFRRSSGVLMDVVAAAMFLN